MKPIGAELRLTVMWWHSRPLAAGDGLRTKTGRCYLVTKVKGKRITATVVPPDCQLPKGGEWFGWAFAPRSR